MKKLFTLAAAAMLSASVAFAFNPMQSAHSLKTPAKRSIQHPSMALRAQAVTDIIDPGDGNKPAGDGFTIQFCEDVYNAYYLTNQNKTTYRFYIYIDPEMATNIAGNQITEITFSNALVLSDGRNGSIFVSEDMEADPVSLTKCHINNCYNMNTGYLGTQTVALESPYTIKEDVGFFFGVTMEECLFSRTGGADYPLAIDGYEANNFAGYVDLINSKGEYLGTFDMAQDMGTNLFLAAKTIGPHDGFRDFFYLGSPVLDEFSLPIVEPGQTLPIYLPIYNMGTNELTSIDYSLAINGGTPVDASAQISIKKGDAKYVVIETPAVIQGRNILNMNIKKVNERAVNADALLTCIAFNGEGYPRRFVIEEATGSWCGYCPAGIVGLEKFSEVHPQEAIIIAAHNGDELSVESYETLAYFIDGYPTAIFNRDLNYNSFPDAASLETIYGYWAGQRGAAQVKLDVHPHTDGTSLNVTTNTTFAFDESDAQYAIAFVILEDGLVDLQKNYYSGKQNGPLEWWDEQPDEVIWEYKDTARGIYSFFGVDNSVPSTVTAGKAVTFNYNIPLENVEDIANTSVVALLIDQYTGVIVNADKVAYADYGEAGVDTIIADGTNAAPAEYYNLQGIRIDRPTAGLYIVRQGDRAAKVQVK